MQTYPLTTAQNNILTMAQYYSGTALCNIGGTIEFDIEGLNADIIEKTINILVEKMDGFRIRLCKNDNNIEQYFEEYSYITIPVVDMRGKSDQDIDEYVQSKIAEPIELFDEQLYRWTILQKDRTWGVLIYMHHMISDAWSFALLAEKGAELFQQMIEGAPIICELSSYSLHIENEAKYFESTKYARDKQFWSSVYAEKPVITQLKPGKEKSRNSVAHRLTEIIDGAFFDRISKFCTEYRYSPAILFEAVVLVYLKKINGLESVPSVGMVALNRLGRSEKNTFGMFISTLPITVPFSVDVSLLDVCKQLSEVQTKAFFHQRYPYTHLLQNIREAHHDIDSLYDVMVSYQNATMHSNVKAHTKWYTNGNSEVPLALHIDDRDNVGKYVLNLDYQLEQFSNEEAELLLKRLLYITEQIVSYPEQTVAETKIIPQNEYTLLTDTFNNTKVAYPSDRCVHELFETIALKNPDKTAVVFEGSAYSYAEINRMANSIAYDLRDHGIGKDDIVPIISIRSHLVIAAQLGVLKAGAAYLPIDPSFPQDRIDYMLDDAKCKTALIYRANKPSKLESVIDLAEISLDKIYSNPESVNNPNDLCYVIYTSGSTGKPKGTMLTHQNVVNYCHSNCHNVHGKVIDDEISRIVSVTTIGFDIYVTESLLALLNGMTVYFANDAESKLQDQLSVLIEQNQIEVIQTTPTKMKMLISNTQNLNYLRFLKKIILGGEPFSEALYQELKEHTSAQIYNIYGPTETTVWSSVDEVISSDISIGTPIANTQIYILSDQNELCPVGIAGELCIAGDGVCRGYLNREELTAEKFIDNPFGCGKLYKTGDLAYYRPDGKLECLGRIDSQVKIRGLRVELGEIESNICAFNGISNTAVVIVKHDGKDFLCTFYQSTLEIDEAELKATLAKAMPNYMIPNLFIRLESFPMTSSGKIARGVLAKYDISGLTTSEEYKAPETELQELLCKEFERLLKISPVSINLDFFGAGGNSIHVIEMLAHLPEEFHLSAKDIYDHPTVKALAEFIETRTEKEYETVSRLVKGEDKQVIVCFPFAGSDDSTFIDLASALKDHLPTITVYALRHANWTEVDFSKAIEEVSQIIEKAESVVFYSHCAGSAMALKLYQNLSDNSKIKRIVMGGNVPPKGIKLYGKRLNPWKFMSDEKLLHTLQNVGMELDGMSEAVKAKLAKQFRIDTECYFREMALLDGVFDIPCTLIVSDADKFTPHIDKAQHAWQHYFKHPIDMVVIHGANHYFHTQRADEVANAIIGLGDLK
ncbi:MAG: amino acid adenylation domain-containing protein [Clostridia bacterium]|nr:amino acid adenylation domain-containing protein [Clostridia bacterium]